MSGVVGRRSPPPFAAPLVILVVHGTITWTLAREIVSAVTRNTPQPLEVSQHSIPPSSNGVLWIRQCGCYLKVCGYHLIASDSW